MASLNKVTLIGNFGNDPELKGEKDNEVVSFFNRHKRHAKPRSLNLNGIGLSLSKNKLLRFRSILKKEVQFIWKVV